MHPRSAIGIGIELRRIVALCIGSPAAGGRPEAVTLVVARLNLHLVSHVHGELGDGRARDVPNSPARQIQSPLDPVAVLQVVAGVIDGRPAFDGAVQLTDRPVVLPGADDTTGAAGVSGGSFTVRRRLIGHIGTVTAGRCRRPPLPSPSNSTAPHGRRCSPAFVLSCPVRSSIVKNSLAASSRL